MININLVGNDEEIKNEEIFNDFDFNLIPLNNLPISYFPLNDALLYNELNKINIDTSNTSNITLTAGASPGNFFLKIGKGSGLKNSYKIFVKKNINCNIGGREILLKKGKKYELIFNLNGKNIIRNNNIEIYNESTALSPTYFTLNFTQDESSNIIIDELKSIINKIDVDTSTNAIIETASDDSNYKIIKYTTIGNSNKLVLNNDIECDILLVGGGGGGSKNINDEGGGGGGGGGVGYGRNISLKKGTYTITIGSGSAGATIPNTQGLKGNDTSLINSSISIIVKGGGGGGIATNGGDGGSGGGTSGHSATKYGGKSQKGTISPNDLNLTFYGNNGGDGEVGKGGGGGGGAGKTGKSTINGNGDGGNGGIGIQINITGSNIFYGGGGGGAGGMNDNGIGGKGGNGGGGDGETRNKTQALSGLNNYGGGGGGGSLNNAGNGGSGIVIIRVKKEDIEKNFYYIDSVVGKNIRNNNEINEELKQKIIEFNNNEKPYNFIGIYPLLILIILIWIFIFLFLLKFIHHYLASIYIYILIIIIIILLFFGSLWFLYTNNDLL